MVYSTRRFVLRLSLCYFVLVFFSPFSIAITSLGEERANLSPIRTFVRFALVWFCLFPLPLGVWEGLRFVIVALPGLFSYPFFDEMNLGKDGLSSKYVVLLTLRWRFSIAILSFVRQWYHMWRLFCHCLFPIFPSVGASGGCAS